MSDSNDVLSWRRVRPSENKQSLSPALASGSVAGAGAGAGAATPTTTAAAAAGPAATESWRNHGRATTTAAAAAPAAVAAPHGRLPRPPAAAFGPATPLNPLNTTQARESTSKPLPHPATYAGTDNWALTPSGSLPSLPGTPNKAHLALGMWQHPHLPGESPSSASGAAAKMHMSAQGASSTSSPRLGPGAGALPGQGQGQNRGTASPSRLGGTSSWLPPSSTPSRGHISPKRSNLSLNGGVGAGSGAAAAGQQHQQQRSPRLSPAPARRSMADAAPSSIASLLSTTPSSSSHLQQPAPQLPAPTLQHRDSMNSVASSSHPLSHSRRSSQVFQNSPASSVVSSVQTGVSRPYRPPQLRGRDSIHSLKPRMTHYDRVRTPSLRGQSRSPDPTSSAFRASISSSRGTSRAPSEVYFSPAMSDALFSPPSQLLDDGRSPPSTRPRGTSRLSSFSGIGPDEIVVPEQNEDEDEEEAEGEQQQQQQHQQHQHQHQQIQTSHPQPRRSFDTNSLMAKLAHARLNDAAASNASTDERERDDDDVDLSAEDMMQPSLTDSFYMSRNGSLASHGPVVDIFEIGDRLGPGMTHDGHRITIAATSEGFQSQEGDHSGSQLQVVRKLGEGSYAVVYLVREISPQEAQQLNREEEESREDARPIARPSAEESFTAADQTFAADQTLAADQTFVPDEAVLATTLKADGAGRLAQADTSADTSLDSASPSSSSQRYFALKCLCKRDLSPEMLEVQRLEATIHQSIPAHPYIVTLYRTYETPEWLFLVLEYCPGQDLYFWLEQAHDGSNLGGQRTNNGDDSDEAPAALDATPPSPSILASTAGRSLLSRRRLRLVSRMFRQMCDAVQFCHDRGISHRDIKPENFIVEDRRLDDTDEDNESAVEDDDRGRPVADGQIVVKLTDFGLAVAQEECIDFDCGSKPYMAFECRNNVAQHYDPRQADVWSLGVVLLNLIFHRSPFSEPNPDRCDSFRSYCIDPVAFLTVAFDGLTQQAAEFLAVHVFCDVTSPKASSGEEDEAGPLRTRISAREFGEWARDLPRHLGLERGREAHTVSRGADMSFTSAMEHSRSLSSSRAPSLLASPNTAGRSLSIPEEDMASWDRWPTLFPEYSMSMATSSELGSLRGSPAARRTPDTKTPSHTSSPGQLAPLDAVPPSEARKPTKLAGTVPGAIAEESESSRDSAAATNQSSTDSGAGANGELPEAVEEVDEEETEEQAHARENGSALTSAMREEEADASDAMQPPRSATTSTHSKRRKRGARKGRTAAKQESKQELKRSRSVENLHLGVEQEQRPSSNPNPRDVVLAELAAASQSLAREMSKAMKSGGTATSSTQPSPMHGSFATRRPQGLTVKTPSPDEHGTSGDPATLSLPPDTPGAASVGRGSVTSRASTQYTNYSWNDHRTTRTPSMLSVSTRNTDNSDGSKWDSAASRRERMLAAATASMPQSGPGSGSGPGSAAPPSSARPTLEDSGRTTVGSQSWWRERNQSQASVSSIDTFSSFASDAGSVFSTASAPAALAAKRPHQHSASPPQTSVPAVPPMPAPAAPSSSSNSDKSAPRRPTRGLLGVATGLDTISEQRTSGKAPSSSSSSNAAHGPSKEQLDASYLAEIFGGNPKAQQERRHQRRQQDAMRAAAALARQQQHQQSGPAAPSSSSSSLVSSGSSLSRSNISVMRPGSGGGGSGSSNINGSSSSIASGQQTAQVAPPVPGTSSSNLGSTTAQGSPSHSQDSDASASTNPRKKMLGKFLMGVKNYNKGVKVAAPPDEREEVLASPTDVGESDKPRNPLSQQHYRHSTRDR